MLPATTDVLTVPVGRYADGELFDLPLSSWHVLVGGLSGAGKSSTLRAIIAGAAKSPDMALVCLDPKVVELKVWRPRASIVANDPAVMGAALNLLAQVVAARYRRLDTEGATTWRVGIDGPLILAVIDELAGLVASGDRHQDRANATAIRQLLERGRAAGVLVVAATQRPSADVIPTSIRDLFSLRICHAMSTAEGTEMVIGPSWRQGPAHDLPVGEAHAGLAYVIVEGSRTPRLARSYWCSPERAARLAVATAGYRTDLDPHPRPVIAVEPAADPFAMPPSGPPQALHEPLADVEAPTRSLVPAIATGPQSLDADEAAVFELIANAGPVRAGLLHVRTRLPEGRARRAAQRLEHRRLVERDGTHWKLAR